MTLSTHGSIRYDTIDSWFIDMPSTTQSTRAYLQLLRTRGHIALQRGDARFEAVSGHVHLCPFLLHRGALALYDAHSHACICVRCRDLLQLVPCLAQDLFSL